MERQEVYKPKIFKGAGVLIGLAIGMVAGIVTVVITGIMGLIGAVSASVAVPAGIYFETKFQGKQKEHKTEEQKDKERRIYLWLIGVGLILFFVCYFLVK
jgi:polyferredoxin